ncbi:MAG: potassium channel family protein [Phycisphaerae bacterium]
MDRIAIIGLGRFGFHLATSLAEVGAEVIGIDQDKELVKDISDRIDLAVALDSTDEKALRAQGLDKVDVAVVGIGSAFEASALTTVILKRLGVPKVIARATTNTRAQVLQAVGADEIVNPEREAAERWRSRLLAPAIMERSALAEGHSLAQLTAPDSFVGKSLLELALGKRYHVLVVAIRRRVVEEVGGKASERQVVITAPGPDDVVKPGDILVVIGSDAHIEALPSK